MAPVFYSHNDIRCQKHLRCQLRDTSQGERIEV